MSAHNSPKWLPSKSKVNTESYTWQLRNLGEENFTYYDDKEMNAGYKRFICEEGNPFDTVDFYGIMGLRSSEFTLSLVNSNGELKKMNVYLWLTRKIIREYIGYDQDDYVADVCIHEKLDDSVKLTLTDTTKPPTYDDASVRDHREDSGNTCIAWIVGKESKKRTTKLTGGMVTAEDLSTKCLFYDTQFVLYSDLIDESKGLLCDGQLEILCEVHTITDTNIFVNSWLCQFEPFKPDNVVNKHTLASDLNQLREKGETCDFIVVAKDGREFPVHTLILASRSTVFDTMLKQDMKEKREKRVVINDMSSETVARLLDFIYTDVIPGMNATLALELLPAADKYQLPRLVTLCEEAMVPDLNVENAAEFLQLADIHNAKQLSTAAKHFIAKNLKGVMASDGWEALKKNRSADLAYDLLEHMTTV